MVLIPILDLISKRNCKMKEYASKARTSKVRVIIVDDSRIFRESLKKELDKWGIFHEYEDRFLDLFGRKNL